MFLPGKSHGWRSLVGYSPWGHKESDTAEQLYFLFTRDLYVEKASGGDGIPVELFQFLKDDAVKVLHSIRQQILKTAVATGLEKVSVHLNCKESQYQRMIKLLHNSIHFTCYYRNAQNSPSQASAIHEP